MKTFLCLLGIFLLYVPCFSAKYYISNKGDNDNSGNQANPFKTLQYAADIVSPGDTIIILSGEYSGFYLDRSGSALEHILFFAETGAEIISNNGITNDAVNLEGANYIIIDGFTITNAAGTISRAGVRSVANTGVIIRNNNITGMGQWGIFTGFSENIRIENNYCSYSQDEHGIYHSNSADNPIIRNNVCYGNNGCGIHMNGDLSMGDDGLISNALVENNTIYNNGLGGGSAINCDGVQNSVFRNNLLYNNFAGGISLFKDDGADGSRNNLIVNNTITMADGGRWAINIKNESTGCKVYNNILFNLGSYRGSIAIMPDCMDDFESDYNILADRFTTNDGNSVMDINEWNELSGNDEHSFTSDPSVTFLDAENNNYQIKYGCLAIDNGIAANAPDFDLNNLSRPQGDGIDIGAYEYTDNPILGIDEEKDNLISIYPNPSHGRINIQSKTPLEKVQVLEPSGRIIYTQIIDSLNSMQIDPQNNISGLYYIQIQTATSVSTIPVYLY